MHARQPDIQIVKYLAVGHAHRAKQFGLSYFKKADVRTVENNSRGVDVAPQYTFFDGEFPGFRH